MAQWERNMSFIFIPQGNSFFSFIFSEKNKVELVKTTSAYPSLSFSPCLQTGLRLHGVLLSQSKN